MMQRQDEEVVHCKMRKSRNCDEKHAKGDEEDENIR